VALFGNRSARPGGQQRASNLGELVDVATGGRRGTAGRAVGWHGVLSIPAVWSAVRLRANVIASLPVGVFRNGPDGLPRRVPDAQVTGALSMPSATFDMVSWLHASQLSLDLRGNAYGKIVARDPRTWLPTQVELVHPDDVTVDERTDGTIEYRFAGRTVDPFDVWHERQNEVPGSVVGMSPITAAARALGITQSAEDYGGRCYD
jgi:phage portal protein BeeE